MAHGGDFKVHLDCKNMASPESRADLHLCALWHGRMGKAENNKMEK